MSLSFTNKIAPNPWDRYIHSYDNRSLNILVGDNKELSDIYTQSSRPASKIIAVSYTHLDVYKRQTQCRILQGFSGSVGHGADYVAEVIYCLVGLVC